MLGELEFSQLSELGQNSQWREIDDDHAVPGASSAILASSADGLRQWGNQQEVTRSDRKEKTCHVYRKDNWCLLESTRQHSLSLQTIPSTCSWFHPPWTRGNSLGMLCFCVTYINCIAPCCSGELRGKVPAKWCDPMIVNGANKDGIFPIKTEVFSRQQLWANPEFLGLFHWNYISFWLVVFRHPSEKWWTNRQLGYVGIMTFLYGKS